MRVACGLDSLILGEPQILGQVKQAFQISEDYYQAANIPLSSTLSRLFQKTFATAKRVRTETNIGESAVSVAYAACSLARQIFESLRELQILLVGPYGYHSIWKNIAKLFTEEKVKQVKTHLEA